MVQSVKTLAINDLNKKVNYYDMITLSIFYKNQLYKNIYISGDIYKWLKLPGKLRKTLEQLQPQNCFYK